MYPRISIALLSLASITIHCGKGDERNRFQEAHCVAAHTEGAIKAGVAAIPVIADNAIKVIKEVPKAAGDATYNVVAAPFRAGRDGVVYAGEKVHQGAKSTAQTVCEHPYATAGILSGLGILGATIHYVRESFPSREESHRRARLEHEEAEHKQQAASLATETEFRTCLNTHFRCMEPGQRMPRQCHSPARRFSLLNATKLDEMLNALNKFKD
jgi:hypothetical protein